MCRQVRWTWAVALGFVLALAGQARADDDDAKPARSGNWFTRLFVKDRAAKKKDAAIDEAKKNSQPPAAMLRQQAQAELLRRQEVCDKLRQIAAETKDKDLGRKADALDQRAWDLYVQRTGGIRGTPSADEQFLDGRLGMSVPTNSRITAPSTGQASAQNDARAAARKE
jgi:hypothetical protein